MSRVPITVLGYHCDRCGHEWIPRDRDFDTEPKACPKCKSPYWNRPHKQKMTYEEFRESIQRVFEKTGKPLTWTEIRTTAGLTQLFPNNRWVKRLEVDIGLKRARDHRGIILWKLEAGGQIVDPKQSLAPT